MARKNLLAGLLDDPAPKPPESISQEEAKPAAPSFGMRGAVGAMSRSLEKLSAQSDAAKALADRFANGEAVVEIDPTAIDASFVPDRMPGSEEDHASLVRSIAETGQLVPVLLRPHPRDPSRFQTAYGHRRIRALSELRKPVRAIIRKMTDEELVIAQGKENGERRDLSFIERANYAVALEGRDFKRDVISAALSVDKTELSRLIGVGRSIPKSLIDAIGPAPKTGRRRWMELEELLKQRSDAAAVIADLVTSGRFAKVDTDARFLLACAALAPGKPAKPQSAAWISEDGKKVASIDRRTGERTTLAVNEKIAPGFGDFVVDRLASLYADYLKEKGT
jgi:ParB family transcriptional regulator, chromosome partitioning protein